MAVLLCGTLLSAALAMFMHTRIEAEAAGEFERRADRLNQVITRQFLEPLQGLQGLAASYDAVGQLRRRQFADYVGSRDLPRHFPSVRGFGFVQRVARDELRSLIAAQRADGAPRFDVRYMGFGNLASLYVIKLLEPAGPPGALGLDLGSDPGRRATIEQTITSGQATLSPRLMLRVDHEDRRPGFLLYVPIFRQGVATTTPERRRAELTGLLFAPIVIADALGDLARHEAEQVRFEVLDPEAATPGNPPIYDSRSAIDAAAGAPTGPAAASRFQAARRLALPGRELTLQVHSGPGIERRIERWIPALVLALGLLLTVLSATWTRRQGSARRAMAEDLRRSEGLLREAMNAIDQGFALYDPADRLVFCNERYRRLYPQTAELLVPGVQFEAVARAGAARGQYKQAGGRVDTWVTQRLAGHRAGNSSVIEPLADGRVLRVVERRMPDGHSVGFCMDITDLVLAREQAERAHRAQAEFIATMSHELRTPLQAITGFSDLGRHVAQDDARLLAMFSDIHDGGMRMLKLVNGLLDISKIDGSPDALTLQPGDLAALAAAVARELHPLAARRALRVRLPEPLPRLAAQVDEFRIRQVIRNLLANAMRFAPEGSTIEIDGTDQGAAGVVLRLRDHGPGIPPDELETIFEAFVQSSRTRDGSGGTGLGLTISRKIVQAHGGRLDAANADGGGAVFTLCLPMATAPSAPAAPRPAAPRAATEREPALATA